LLPLLLHNVHKSHSCWQAESSSAKLDLTGSEPSTVAKTDCAQCCWWRSKRGTWASRATHRLRAAAAKATAQACKTNSYSYSRHVTGKSLTTSSDSATSSRAKTATPAREAQLAEAAEEAATAAADARLKIVRKFALHGDYQVPRYQLCWRFPRYQLCWMFPYGP